ncbi:MAG TPA: hypothetical protein QF520_05650, partial [SAR202 cluster bacterium]|nr:hypothetical protein [SAR202 cluster bacterium]
NLWGGGSMAIVSTTGGFESADDVDAYFDSVFGDEARMAGIDALGAMCDQMNVSVSRLVTVTGLQLDGFAPKIM